MGSEDGARSRRAVLAGSAAGGVAMAVTAAGAASFGNPDQPPQGAVNVTDPGTLATPGPHDDALAGTEPSFLSPPPTDVGSSPQFWASFNLAPRRIQDGGWGRQVTQSRFRDLDRDLRRQHAPVRRRHPRAALAPAGRVGDHDLRPLPHHRAGRAGPPMPSRTSRRAISGTSRPACRTRCRGSGQTAPSSSWPSTTARRRSSTPCRRPTGSPTRRPTSWP